MTDTLTGDIGNDRAAFAISSLVSRDPHVTGDPCDSVQISRKILKQQCYTIQQVARINFYVLIMPFATKVDFTMSTVYKYDIKLKYIHSDNSFEK